MPSTLEVIVRWALAGRVNLRRLPRPGSPDPPGASRTRLVVAEHRGLDTLAYREAVSCTLTPFAVHCLVAGAACIARFA